MADVDPEAGVGTTAKDVGNPFDVDLEAAAEAIYKAQSNHDCLDAAAAVLAALRAEGWTKAGEDWTFHDALTAIAAARQEADEWDHPNFDWRMLARKMESIARRALAEGPVGEMRRTSEASSDPTRGLALPATRMGAAQAEPERKPIELEYLTDEEAEAKRWQPEIDAYNAGAKAERERLAASMSHAVLGDETSTSGGVGNPSAAVPEQPSYELHGWLDEEDDFVSVEGPNPYEVDREWGYPTRSYLPIYVLSGSVDRTVEPLAKARPVRRQTARGVSDSEAEPEVPPRPSADAEFAALPILDLDAFGEAER